MVTAQDDVTADHVITHLHQLQVPVLRLDLGDFPYAARLDALAPGRGAGWSGTLTAHGHTAALEDVRAVWWWHYGYAQPPTQGPAELAEWCARNSTAAIAGVLASLDCLQVGHPVAVHAGESKADWLVQAARCGLRTPPTWIGNAVGSARGFQAAAPQGVVTKSLVRPDVEHGDGSRSMHRTRPVPRGALDDTVAYGGHQLQHAVHKQFEVRLTVVGERLFAARMDGHSEAARWDFRADPASLTYSPISLPTQVRDGVRRLMAHYQLHYAAIDLLVDHDNRWWICDLNPAGQYGWIETELPDLRISTALAELLAQGTAAGPAPPYSTRRTRPTPDPLASSGVGPSNPESALEP